MSSLPIKMLKDENGEIFIPVTSTLGIDSNGKTLREEITDLLNRVVGLAYIPPRIEITATTAETGPVFDEITLGTFVLEFGKLTTGESLIKFGDYELKTTIVDSENFTVDLTDGVTTYSSSNITKDVVLDMYNRLIIYFSGTSLIFGLNGVSGGIISAPGIQGIPVDGISIPMGNDFAIYRLYVATGDLSSINFNAITMSDLNFDIDRVLRPYLCNMYYRNFIDAVMINEGLGGDALDWAVNQGTWFPGYNIVSGMSYPGLSQKPAINGVTLVGNKTTEELLIEAGGGSWGEIEGTLSDQTDLQGALDGKVDEISGKGLSTEDYTTTEKTKLSGIAENANNYTLPTASDTILGGVKVGTRLTMTDGVLSADEQVGGLWGDITGTLSNQTDLQGALDGKVDKITGKGLSTEDYTTVEKSKLSGIEEGANNYVLPLAALMLQIYPVGSIYMSVNNTNPDGFFGGIWVPWGSGRVPVGVDITDADFNTVEKTGGSSEVALTEAQLATHTHIQNEHNHTQNAHSHVATTRTTTYGQGYQDAWRCMSFVGTNNDFAQNVNTGNATATNIATTATNQNAGSGQAHDNKMQYITCYMWKRTA